MHQEDRGSAKLGVAAVSLEKALAAAKVNYLIERWWKYGQPAIDRIQGVINVTNFADAGRVVQELASQQGKTQINLEVFPYGIINPDGVRISFNMEQKVAGE
jgi:hypothetical protein